jgi:hypothetical protein
MKKYLSYAAQSSAGTATRDLSPEKSASLTYFHFEGDSALYKLIQNAQVNLQHCIDGYSKSVMLKENFSAPGQTQPTKVLKPNKAVFLGQLNELVNEGYYVDIFIFAHGSPDRIYMANDLTLSTTELKDAVAEEKSGFRYLPIRMVYQMNCYGRTFNQTWLDIGAKLVCGSRYVNFYPNQFNKFATDWNKGNVLFEKAVYDSNTESSRTVMQTLIAADAASELFPKDWDKCPIGSTVLGDKPCAKSYFKANWGIDGDEWQEGKSGKDNMNHSSYMFTPGMNITKSNKGILVWHP